MSRIWAGLAICTAVIVAAVCLSGCGKEGGRPRAASETPTSGISISGAGATFPYPVYAKWADKYNELTGVRVNYQSIGSGGGVQQIKAGTVDFGASDAPLTAKELDEAGLIQFPMVLGGVVPVKHNAGEDIPGRMRLDGKTLAAIFTGKITTWHDPAIAGQQRGVMLEGTKTTVVHRADGSGTTWIFTNYLDKVSPDWHARVGFGKAVNWPVGVGGKGNEGVAAYVQRIAGSVGYVEYAYALQNKMAYLSLKNHDGEYVKPSIETFQAAAANADWKHAPGFYMVLTDQPGKKSWPITGATYILIRKHQKDAKLAKAMLDFFDWAYSHGGTIAKELQYVPMPDNVVELVRAEWRSKVVADGKPVWK